MRDYRDLKVADPDGPRKWREWYDEQEAHFAEERVCEERCARGEIETLRNELNSEIAAVRAAVDRRADVHIEAVGEVIGMLRGEVADQVERALKDIQSQYRGVEGELFRLVERRFAELAGRLDALVPDARSRTKREFRFATEKSSDDETTIDMPNPIAPRGSELN
jgi:hypothetical protein